MTTDTRTETTATVTGVKMEYAAWHSTMGRSLVSLRDRLLGSTSADMDIWLDCGPLIDWISLEYAARSYGSEPVLPTEMLNADGSRAFGAMCRKNFLGSCYVVAVGEPDLLRAMAEATSGDRTRMLVSVTRRHDDTWTVYAEAIGQVEG